MRAEPSRSSKSGVSSATWLAGSTIDLDEITTPEILDPRAISRVEKSGHRYRGRR